MTDEAPKKAWARCPACSTVYPNIQIAKDGHKLNCPYDIKLRLQDLEEKRIPALEQKILDLGGNLDEISSDPGIDFTGVEDDTVGTDDPEPVQVSQYIADELPAQTTDDGWDEEDEVPVSAAPIR